MDFKNIYKKATEETKLKFLNAIIKYNDGLQQEFLNFAKQNETITDDDAGAQFDLFQKKIIIQRETYLTRFENVDMENPDWESYQPPHSGYIEEWEQYQQATEQEFERVFQEFRTSAIEVLIEHDIVTLMAGSIGIYEAAKEAKIEDPYESFSDVNEYLTEELVRIIRDLSEKIKKSAVPGYKVTRIISFFLKYSDKKHVDGLLFFKHIEPLLLALSDKSDKPETILAFIDASKAGRKNFPQLVSLLLKNSGDEEQWHETAKQFYQTDNEVAKQLLDYYLKNAEDAFVRIANELFDRDKHFWSAWLESKISLELDKTLFFKVFYQLTISRKEIRYYNRIRELLTPSDFEQLLTEIKWDLVFVVKILEVEKKFEKIRQIVEDNPDSWDYEDIIRPILMIFPGFCFNNIKEKAEKALQTKRGRSTYQWVASLLKLTAAIPGYQPQNSALITTLYNHKPNLPALRDEFRKAGLID